MKLLLFLMVVAAFAATGTSAGTAEDALHHIFNAMDSDNDGTLSKSDVSSFAPTLTNPQTWRNFDQSSVTALTQHVATHASEIAKRAQKLGEIDSITYDKFKYMYALSNGGRAVVENRALLGIMSGILLMCIISLQENAHEKNHKDSIIYSLILVYTVFPGELQMVLQFPFIRT